MTNHPIKVGLLGLGKMGQNHLRILSMLKKVDLRFIYDIDIKKMERLAEERNTASCTDLTTDISSQNLDAVVICTPTSTHAEYIKQVAPYVKNIFIEKPMGASIEETESIVEIIEKNKINLQVGFIERFNPVVAKLKSVLDGENKIINIDFTRTNKISARITDVDVITDLMIHDIDLALYLNGPAVSISAHGTTRNNLVSFASAILTHEGGTLSHIQASRITEKRIRRIEATCENIFIDCELFRKELITTKQSELIQEEGKNYSINSVQENIEVKQQEALLLELQSFIKSCNGEENDNNPTAHDALNAMKVCSQIQKEIYQS